MKALHRATPWFLSALPALMLAGAASADETKGYGPGSGTISTNGTTLNVPGWIEASTGYITPWNDPNGETACVDVWGGGSANSNAVGMWSCNGGAGQSWKITTSGQIVGIDGKCLDDPHSSTTPGTYMQLYPCNGGANQQWSLRSDHTLRSGAGANVCLALPAGSNIYAAPNQGLALIIDTCDPSSANQQWMVHGVGEFVGPYDQVFDIPAGNTTNGTAIGAWSANGGSNQKWTFTEINSATFFFPAQPGNIVGLNGKCLDLAGGATSAGTALVVNDCNGGFTQQWYQSGSSLRNPAAPGMCVDYASPIQLQPCNGSGSQEWVYTQPITVPIEAQQESKWCWAAVARMTMEYLGDLAGPGTPSQCQEINTRLGFTGNQDCCATQSWSDPTTFNGTACNHTGGTNDILNDWGFGFTCNNGAPVSFATLQGEIAAGRPVPTAISWNTPGGGGHAILVIAAWPDVSGTPWVTVNDPWGGDQYAMPYSVWANTNPSVGNFTTTRELTGVAYGSTGTCN